MAGLTSPGAPALNSSGSAGTPENVTPTVDIVGVGRAFDGRPVLDGIDLRIAPGEFVALLGRSGSGKSTLLRILAGLDRGHTGTVHAPERVAVAFQEPRLLPWKRVADNVALGLRGADTTGRAAAALAEVGLTDRARAWPLTLSGGEAQRASLARALVRDPALLLLDEPFAALDALTRLSMHDLVLQVWARHRPAVLLVTHDVDEAVALADRVLVLQDGHFTVDESLVDDRPRDRGAPGFAHHRRFLLAALGVST